MKIRKVSSFLILSLTIASCKNSTDTPTSTDLIPLKTGNQWIYETTVYNDSGIATKKTIDTTIVGTDFNAQGLMWHFLTWNGVGGFLSSRNNGLWSYDSSNQKSFLEYQYPTLAGNEYIAEYDSTSNGFGKEITVLRIKVISTNELVTTAIGKFSCYHYQYDMELTSSHGDVTDVGELLQDIYFAPNVGLLKVTEPRFTSDGKPNGFYLISVLKQYTLK
jgi:hypothetical protein